jgi:hypothetical protein
VKVSLHIDYNYCIEISSQKCYLFRLRVAEDVVPGVFGCLNKKVTNCKKVSTTQEALKNVPACPFILMFVTAFTTALGKSNSKV